MKYDSSKLNLGPKELVVSMCMKNDVKFSAWIIVVNQQFSYTTLSVWTPMVSQQVKIVQGNLDRN